MRKIAFLLSLLTAGCSNFNISSHKTADERGGNEQITIKSNTTDTIYFNSRISNPYIFEKQNMRSPDYSESSLQIEF
jgi:hypothetical protein